MTFTALVALTAATACVDPADDDVETDTAWTSGKADGPGTSGALRVTELLARASDPSSVFVELINQSDAPVDLADCTLSIGTKKLRLTPVADHAHIVQPQQLAVIGDGSVAAAIPVDAAMMTTSVPLAGPLAKSQRLLVRVAGRASDKADASTAATSVDLAVERTADGRFEQSSIGKSPGERNAIHGDEIAVYFANPPVDTADPVAPHLQDVIDHAQHTLDAAFFQVNNPALIDAFVRATQRGVKVRFVTDTQYFTDPSYAPGYQRLVDAGIPVIDDKRGALMHSKFMVVDDEAVWTGSYNLIVPDRRVFDHADNALYLHSRQLAAIHTAQFEQLFAGTFGNRKRDLGQHDVYIDGVHIEVYFAPTDHLRDHAIAAVAAARARVHFAMFSFFQGEVASALESAHLNQVEIEGVFDKSSISIAGSQFTPLAQTGIDVRSAGPSVFLHDKFFVIDPDTAAATVVTGSPNVSDNAYNSNDEAMYVVHDRAIAARYETSFHVFFDLQAP